MKINNDKTVNIEGIPGNLTQQDVNRLFHELSLAKNHFDKTYGAFDPQEAIQRANRITVRRKL